MEYKTIKRSLPMPERPTVKMQAASQAALIAATLPVHLRPTVEMRAIVIDAHGNSRTVA